MTLLIIFVLVVIAGLMIWLAAQSGEFEVKRSRFIQVPAEVLYAKVSDFHAWPEWNPWLPHEPTAKLQYSESNAQAGSWYSWDGKIIGAGKLTHNMLTPPACIDETIEFTRPMRSRSKVYWRFEQQEGGTLVTWGMQGKMPFLFRWMSGKMDDWVGKDYETGLAQLATVCGDMTSPLRLEYPGEVNCEPETYLYTSYSGPIADMPQAMKKAFAELDQAIAELDLEVCGPALAVYHELDQKKDFVRCDTGIVINHAHPVENFSVGHLPQQRYQRTVSYGAYEHLPLAWGAAFSHQRMSKAKIKKGAPMVERYPTNPKETSGLDVVTWIDLPLR